jgi:hypothetical protein
MADVDSVALVVARGLRPLVDVSEKRWPETRRTGVKISEMISSGRLTADWLSSPLDEVEVRDAFEGINYDGETSTIKWQC